jgi:hypothetical protein
MKVSELVEQLSLMSRDGRDREVVLRLSHKQSHARDETSEVKGRGELQEVYGEASTVELCAFNCNFFTIRTYPSGREDRDRLAPA